MCSSQINWKNCASGLEMFDTIEQVDLEMRGIIERNWPHLLPKLPPEDFEGIGGPTS